MTKCDNHSSCARCRDKGIGSDPCTLGLLCKLCESLTPQQKEQLARRVYIPKRERPRSVSSDSSHQSAGTATVERVLTSSRSKQPKKKQKKDNSALLKAEIKVMKDQYARLEALMLAKSFNPVSAPISSAPVVLSSTLFFQPTSASTAGSSAPLLPLESNIEEMAVLSAEDVSSVLAEVSATQVSSVDPDISMSAALATNSVSAEELNSVNNPLPVMESAALQDLQGGFRG